jgi:hypothetical protein
MIFLFIVGPHRLDSKFLDILEINNFQILGVYVFIFIEVIISITNSMPTCYVTS